LMQKLTLKKFVDPFVLELLILNFLYMLKTGFRCIVNL